MKCIESRTRGGRNSALDSNTQNTINHYSQTIYKRSTTMSKTLILSLVALLVLAGLTFGQNLVIQSGSSFTGSGSYVIKGNIDNTGVAVPKIINGTVKLSKTGAAQTIGGGSGAINFQTLRVDSSGTKTTSVADTVTAALVDSATGGKLAIGTQQLVLQGSITGKDANSYDFSNASSEVIYAQTGGNQSIFGTTYGKLTPNGSATFNLLGPAVATGAVNHTGGALTVNQNLNANAGYTFGTVADITSGDSLKLSSTGGSIATLTDAHGAVVNGSGALTVTNLTNSHGTITSAANGGPMSFTNAATNNGVIGGGAGLVHFLNTLGNSDSLLAGSGGMKFENKVTNNSGAGIAANSGDSLFFNSKIDNSGRIDLFGTGYASLSDSFLTVGALNLASTSTWNYNGGNQTVAGAASGVTYGNLLMTGSGVKTALGNIPVSGNFDNGGPSDLAITTDMSTFTLSITGSKENTNSTILFGGTNNGLLFTTGTVNYNAASGTQQVAGDPALNYNLLVFSGGGTKQIASGIRVGTASNLTINAGVIADVNAATSQLLVLGNLINGGTLNNAGTVQVGN